MISIIFEIILSLVIMVLTFLIFRFHEKERSNYQRLLSESDKCISLQQRLLKELAEESLHLLSEHQALKDRMQLLNESFYLKRLKGNRKKLKRKKS